MAGFAPLFVTPAPNHLLVTANDNGPRLQRFVTMAVGVGLTPFAGALAIDIYIPGPAEERIDGG
jgi:hypothetical protein